MGTAVYQTGDVRCKAGRIWFPVCVVSNFYICFKCLDICFSNKCYQKWLEMVYVFSKHVILTGTGH